jgi:hypothetical protein
MRKTRTKPGVAWRWRHNELRRRSDTVEAWIILSAWALATVGGATAGSVAALAVVDAVDAQHAARHPVQAVLIADAPAGRPTAEDANGDLVSVSVRWTTPEGASRTGTAKVATGTEAGTRVHVWADRNDRLTPAPLSAGETAVQAGLAGSLAAAGTGGVVLLGGRALRAQLDRQRMRQWEREWEEVGPTWRRKAR